MANETLKRVRGLDSYELAFLCGDVYRVVMVALVGLYEEGKIKITVARPRVTVRDRQTDDAIQRAVLGTVPDRGKGLTILVREFAGSPEIAEITGELRARKLMRRRFPWNWFGPLTRRGQRLVKELKNDVPDQLHLPILGVEAIEDDQLRRFFAPREPRNPTRYYFEPSILDDHKPAHGYSYL
jgi:hypothetical protein